MVGRTALVRGALLFSLAVFCLLGGCSGGRGTFVKAIDAGGETQPTNATDFTVQMGERDFCGEFDRRLSGKAKLKKSPGKEQTEQELVFSLEDYNVQPTDRVLGWVLHLGLSGEEVASVTITMPTEPLKSEKEAPKGDAAALDSVRAYNETLAAERALFMDTVDAALRSANRYKQLFQESDILLMLSDAEKTVKKGTEKSQKYPSVAMRSFVLDVSETARIVFTLDFSL